MQKETEYILHNGMLHLQDASVLKADNRAFRYGDGLFESMRMGNGRLYLANEHADRLNAGMSMLKIEGSLLDEYFFKQKTAELAKKNKWNHARFRLTVYRDGDGYYTPTGNKAAYLLQGVKINSPHYELNKKGFIADVYDEITKPINGLSNLKTTNALLYVLASIFKKNRQLDEVFLLNQAGYLCESLSANIFVVYKHEIYTPALTEGCVAGVMRQEIMRLAKNHDVPIKEAQINPAILYEAEEVFTTNAVNGISWIMGYGNKRYFNELSRFLTDKLRAETT